MRYNFICDKCKKTKEVEVPYTERDTVEVFCDDCKIPMRRNWKSAIFVSNECKSSEIEETSWLKERMKVRPSGKTRAIY